MASNLLSKGFQYARDAGQSDERGHLNDAVRSYLLAVEYLLAAKKYEKDKRRQTTLESQCEKFLNRVEELKQSTTPPTRNKEESPPTPSPPPPPPSHSVSWEDIAGLFEAKRLLQETILMPRKFPKLFENPERQPWSALLLYGPPGTGKSHLAKAVATELAGSSFFSVSSADLVSKWVGDSEKRVHELFEAARAARPAVIFMDEIDSLGRSRGDGQDTDHGRRLLNQILTELDGVGKSMEGILFLAATNMPWSLDSALRRRFQKRIYIPLPNASARAQMFKIHLGRMSHPLTLEDLHALASATENYSGSDIRGIVREALMMPLRMVQDATHFKRASAIAWTPCSPGDPEGEEKDWRSLTNETLFEPPLTLQHFQHAVASTRPTVSVNELEQYAEWTRQFGLDG